MINRLAMLAALLTSLTVLTACNQEDNAEQTTPPASSTAEVSPPVAADPTAVLPSEADRFDPHSFSEPDRIVIEHLQLELRTDFDRRVLEGQVVIHLKRLDDRIDRLILDTRDLSISEVTANGAVLDYQLSEVDPVLGQALIIQLPDGVSEIAVNYRTAPEASGLQWLNQAQTRDERGPFLFTQSQAIHARSWIPLQDTPAVRFTYEATVTTRPGMRAVMSADNDPNAEATGVDRFSMPQAIPSYLMALAAGVLEFAAISDRSGVYAEPSLVIEARDEFIDTEAMIVATEALFGDYQWGRYDLLILPPSFPFGGMENPRLSFITPTVIAGDKSLVALIAHELAHSWSGNLVTNARWNDLWLNEGFTVYLESRIMEAVYGQKRRQMEDVLGYQSLLEDIETLPPEDTRLLVNMTGRDPDDVFSNVPYEKGRSLLVFIEQAVGREAFDAWLRGYFDRHAFNSLDTAAFLDDLQTHLIDAHPDALTLEQVTEWIHQPGLPETVVVPVSDVFTTVDTLRSDWLAGRLAADAIPADGWTVHEWLYFLNNMPDSLSSEQMTALDQAHDLTSVGNNEIAHSWLLLAIANHYQAALPRLRSYLLEIGRRKLVVPLYEALMKTDWGQEMAVDIFEQASPGFHPLTRGSVACVVLPDCGR